MNKQGSIYLNSEMDEVNDAIEYELAAGGYTGASQGKLDVWFLRCNKCGDVQPYDKDLVDDFCTRPGEHAWTMQLCNGTLKATREDHMINLPEPLKHRKKGGNAPVTVPGSTGGWQGGSDYHGYQGTTYKACSHPGDKVIFERAMEQADGSTLTKQLFGSNGSSLKEFSGAWGLILDLAGIVTRSYNSDFVEPSKEDPEFDVLKALCFNAKPLPSKYLRLRWTDMGIPPVGLKFWQQLWEMLPERTVMACVGGHGRTGTCMASFMITAGVDYYTAVQTVREEHCNKAIENVAQELYLHRLWIAQLEWLKQQNPTAAELIDINEDIKYAETHIPNHTSSYGETPKEGDKSPLVKARKGTGFLGAAPQPHLPGTFTQVTHVWDPLAGKMVPNPALGKLAPENIKVAEPVIMIDGMNGPRNAKEIIQALTKMGINCRKDGEKWMVQECTDKECKKWICVEASHQHWISLEDSFVQFGISVDDVVEQGS